MSAVGGVVSPTVRRVIARRVLFVLALLSLAAEAERERLAWPVTAVKAMAALENRFPPWTNQCATPIAGIVALGGSFNGINDPGARMKEAIDLARRFPTARVMYSGKKENDGIAAVDAGKTFEQAGVAADRVLLEGNSHDTRENALFSSEVARPAPADRWLLVTSAFHMPRAMGVFRAVGFNVEAVPVERGITPRSGVEFIALKEIEGLIAYRLQGWSDAFFPGPLPPRCE